ncbi:MAG: ATP-dependent helicase C-terminal domain-containing protein, partial [Longimicrobiales bacterium]
AALLAERDILRADRPVDADVRLRLDVVRRARTRRTWPRDVDGVEIDRGALRRVLAESDALRARWRDRTGSSRGRGASETDDTADAGLLLAFAYPDRIAQVRTGTRGRFLLRSGRGASMDGSSSIAGAEYVVAAAVDERGAEGRIFLAAALTRADIDAHFGDQVGDEEVIEWDDTASAVRVERRTVLGALVLDRKPPRDADPEAVTRTLLDAVAREGLEVLPWTDAARSLQRRLVFLHALDPNDWPDASDASLHADLPHWLGPHITGMRSLTELKRLDLEQILEASVPPRRRNSLRSLAPTHLEVPSGSRIAIDYRDPASPALAVRLQEVFGLIETPRVGGGRVPLTMHLLSPAHRPVQVTRDLSSFWRTTYFDVRKDLRGRYPKHHWPEDPLTATPVRGAKRRE